MTKLNPAWQTDPRGPVSCAPTSTEFVPQLGFPAAPSGPSLAWLPVLQLLTLLARVLALVRPRLGPAHLHALPPRACGVGGLAGCERCRKWPRGRTTQILVSAAQPLATCPLSGRWFLSPRSGAAGPPVTLTKPHSQGPCRDRGRLFVGPGFGLGATPATLRGSFWLSSGDRTQVAVQRDFGC